MTQSMQCNHKGKQGFSLIELLMVMAIIAIMTAMMMPLLSGFTGTAGRRGAVNSLMNAFEQARVAALETSTTVYVVMRRSPNVGEQDAFIIARKSTDSLGEATTPAFVTLSRWQKLPKGVSFFKAQNTLVDKGAVLPANLAATLPGNVAETELFCIGFNRNGQVAFPSTGKLALYLAESTRADVSKDSAKQASAAITERLSFRRFTGRATLDYTADHLAAL